MVLFLSTASFLSYCNLLPSTKFINEYILLLFTETFLLLTTSGSAETHFSFAEPQDDQAASVQAMLPVQHDQQQTPFAC